MSSVEQSPFSTTAFSRQQQLKRNVMISSRLQSIGVSTEIDLPQICVLGSQSAGKSSLIESISTIALPRASGTCTRCPTECTMGHSDERWQCDVFLRFTYDSENWPLTGEHIRDIKFGDTLYTREDVQDRVRRAQLAILNPDLNNAAFPDLFLTSEPPFRSQMTFSRNTVVLKVSGPDIVDLSFVDLPGIIATAVNGADKDDIKAVRDLACDYIKNPNAIILLTVTCETDADNQGAYEFVKEYDPEGSRTIGVATKPDRIEPGQENRWFDVLRNKIMHVWNNWYCVKLPGPKQLEEKISWKDARLHETEFFNQGPWTSQLDLRLRLGVPPLVDKLSTLLSDHVAKTLPELLAKINAKIDEIRTEAGRLPLPTAGKPAMVVTQLVIDFQRKVDVEVAGTISGNGLIQKMIALANKFQYQLRGSAPRFIPFRLTEPEGWRKVPLIQFLPEEEQDLHNDGTHPVLNLSDVESRAKSAMSRELPGNVPFAVKKEMIQNFIELWRQPADELLSRADSTISSHFTELCDRHFKNYNPLRKLVIAKLNGHRLTCGKLAKDRVNLLFDLEHEATFTMNHLCHSAYRRNFEAFYRALRWSHRPVEDPAFDIMVEDENIHRAEKQRRRLQLANQLNAGVPTDIPDLLKLIPGGCGDNAIGIIADVRAYWQVAFKRFVDYIPLAIDKTLVREFGKDLIGLLLRELGVTGADADKKCAAYLSEPVELVAKRKELQDSLNRLVSAKDAIEDWAAN